jgi:hypothetical protein
MHPVYSVVLVVYRCAHLSVKQVERVRLSSFTPVFSSLAQLVEQHLDMVKVTSSTLVGTTSLGILTANSIKR